MSEVMTPAATFTGRPEPLPIRDVGAILERCDRLQMIAFAADRALTRLTHPTIDYEEIPREVLHAALLDLREALATLSPADRDDLDLRPPAPLRRDLWDY